MHNLYVTDGHTLKSSLHKNVGQQSTPVRYIVYNRNLPSVIRCLEHCYQKSLISSLLLKLSLLKFVLAVLAFNEFEVTIFRRYRNV